MAKGYKQVHYVDYTEIFSPVAIFQYIQILLATTAFYDYKVWKIDVKITFLNGFLENDVYMIQWEGFYDLENPKKVCKPQKSIY